jgi:hypothetical protein
MLEGMRFSFEGISRRQCLAAAPLGVGLLQASPVTIMESYPMQPVAMVREIVSVSHGNFQRMKELVESRPSLAKASWDWGFGDWETALGAALHTGHREIAEFLIANGARPSLFSAAMPGQLEVVKAFVATQPGVQKIEGPQSITLLAHAKAGGAQAEAVRRYLEELGDANGPAKIPVTDEDLVALPGVYAPGEIQITASKRDLMSQRSGTVALGLVHLGGRVFHPAGASAVRVSFREIDGKAALVVKDGEIAVTAYRQ